MSTLCTNCQARPARLLWTLDDGSVDYACGDCGRPASGVAVRDIDADDVATPATLGPLTVAEAAAQERVDVRTIYRWLTDGDLGEGAWKVGSAWRIDPAALLARRLQGARPQSRTPKASAPTRRAPKSPASTADNMGWPSA